MSETTDVTDFVAFSSAITGFSAFQLLGTGQAELYYKTLTDVVGTERVAKLLGVFKGLKVGAPSVTDLESRLRADVFSDAMLGPIARNIIKLWYVGNWYPLPSAWRAAFGSSPADTPKVASPIAYTEGLLWRAIGANPSGARAPGYGSWANEPVFPK